MADVTLTYKGATIAELDDSGSKTLRTAGKFCEADIGVEYVKPSGGGNADFLDYNWPSGAYASSDSFANGVPACAFAYRRGITSISMPNITRTQYAGAFGTNPSNDAMTFYGCTNLKSVSFANLASAYKAKSLFRGCTNLETINWPKNTSIGSMGYGFYGCTSLTTMVCNKLTDNYNTIDGYTFGGCTSLVSLDFNTLSGIAANAFNGASKLNVLIIRSRSSVKTLSNVNAFAGTPFASSGAGGTLYVPSSLVSVYQSATNWSTVLNYANNQIFPIEGSIYETQYADGTPIPTT